MDDWCNITDTQTRELILELKKIIGKQSEEINTNTTSVTTLAHMFQSYKAMTEVQQKIIEELKIIVLEQSRKITKLGNMVKNMENRIIEKNEREINKAIRQYAINHEPVKFISSKTPISKYFE